MVSTATLLVLCYLIESVATLCALSSCAPHGTVTSTMRSESVWPLMHSKQIHTARMHHAAAHLGNVVAELKVKAGVCAAIACQAGSQHDVPLRGSDCA